MASWKKYFSAVPTQARLQQKLQQQLRGDDGGHGSAVKFNSFLPEVYSGAPNRIERYLQYELMDSDSEISRALDTISDFSTHNYDINDEPFTFNFKGKLTETEIELLKQSLSQWCKINKWHQRMWRMFRNTIKYGDQVFIRDPETFELVWIDPTKVEKLIVNESKGKEIEQYVIRDLNLNLNTLVGTNMLVHDQYSFPGGYPRTSNPSTGTGGVNYGTTSSPGSRNSRFDNAPNQTAVNAEHVVHLSLSEGLDSQWPFGTSILESIYKVYKQKDLLEDAILIYRIVRAPERRVFYIDTGSLAGPRAMQYVERIKNEIYSRRIPNRTGGGQSIIDSGYNPLAINEDFYLATNSEGKGTRIETLPGGENLGCFSLDTKVVLLDGRELSISDIAAEINNGKQLWTYSCHPITGEIVPGKISWAGKTKTNAKVLKLTLDNGNTITCTPDHKFPIRGLGFIEAKDFIINQKLIGLNVLDVSNSIDIYVVSIEYLDEVMDVGTLTVDGNEEFHNYHTYALAAGVFVKNSIDDLRYFNNKMIRGLGVPSSYLPTGAEDGTAQYTDGKVGTAYVQEYRFSKYCQRLQNLLTPELDKEFKMFIKNRGIEIQSDLFDLRFYPPQSFSQYRQMQMDSEQVSLFSSIMGTEASKYVSKRYALERYLGWSEDDILRNERLWKEENAEKVKDKIGTTPGTDNNTGLSGVGIRSSTGMDDLGDLGMEPEGGEDMGEIPGGSAVGEPGAAPSGAAGGGAAPSSGSTPPGGGAV